MSSASELDMLEPFSPSPQLGNTPGGRTPAASPMHLTAKLKAMKVRSKDDDGDIYFNLLGDGAKK